MSRAGNRAGTRSLIISVFALILLARISVASAQLDNRTARIVLGHYTLNATSIEEHLRFWVDALGGEPVQMGENGIDAVRFPGVFIFLNQQAPNGPTWGTTFDHIGFAVPDVAAVTARVVEAGFSRTVGREPETAGAASPPTGGDYGRFEYLLGPDGVKVELVTADGDDAPAIAHHHVHFVNREFTEMGQWYMRVLNATQRPGPTYDYFFGADLPGVGYMLNYFSWLPEQQLVGTAGRVVDHVGFEVRNLEAYCLELEAKGIELTESYRVEDGFGIAVITDPWGTVVELTEGLRDVYLLQ